MHRFPDHDTLLRFVRRADAAISTAGVDGAILHALEADVGWNWLDVLVA